MRESIETTHRRAPEINIVLNMPKNRTGAMFPALYDGCAQVYSVTRAGKVLAMTYEDGEDHPDFEAGKYCYSCNVHRNGGGLRTFTTIILALFGIRVNQCRNSGESENLAYLRPRHEGEDAK